jgi:hypothetical protein
MPCTACRSGWPSGTGRAGRPASAQTARSLLSGIDEALALARELLDYEIKVDEKGSDTNKAFAASLGCRT